MQRHLPQHMARAELLASFLVTMAPLEPSSTCLKPWTCARRSAWPGPSASPSPSSPWPHNPPTTVELLALNPGLAPPPQYVAWVELVIISLVTPNASFLGHLAGILAGLLHIAVIDRGAGDHMPCPQQAPRSPPASAPLSCFGVHPNAQNHPAESAIDLDILEQCSSSACYMRFTTMRPGAALHPAVSAHDLGWRAAAQARHLATASRTGLGGSCSGWSAGFGAPSPGCAAAAASLPASSIHPVSFSFGGVAGIPPACDCMSLAARSVAGDTAGRHVL
jgi:hypothetical protein